MPAEPGLTRYRLLTEEDLPEAWHLLTEGLNAVRGSVNRPPLPKSEKTLTLLRHLLAHDSPGAWAVEQGHRLRGICLAVLRERQWFLSHFWIQPGLENQGLGWPLLQRVWEYGQSREATHFSTHASPDPTAHALYIRIGMDPLTPVHRLEGSPDAARRFAAQRPNRLRVRRFDIASLDEVAAELARLDRTVRGAERLVDHRYWLQSADVRAAVAYQPGQEQAAGYWYAFHDDGFLGPVVASQPAYLPDLLAQAMQSAQGEISRFHLYAPAPTSDTVRCLMEAGFRVVLFNVLFSSAPFPQPASYIPSGPDLW